MTTSVLEDKIRLAKGVAQGIEKQFGKGAIMRLGEAPTLSDADVLSTGSVGIDRALGVGGLPKGRIVEIFGPEASGKTTVALQTIAALHQRGGLCAFIDAEHALDMRYAQALGVDPELLMVTQPDSGEQALEIAEHLVRSGSIDLVVVDSVAALVPRAEIEGEMGDAHMGIQARLMSQAMRKLTGIAHRTGCTLIFINQLRQKIGVVFGNPEVTTGGNALKFYASVRIDVRRIGALKEEGELRGHRARVKIVKNKVAPPFQEVELDIRFGKGVWHAADLIDRAVEAGVLQRTGAWIAWGDTKLGQGRSKAATRLEEDVKLQERLREALASEPAEREAAAA